MRIGLPVSTFVFFVLAPATGSPAEKPPSPGLGKARERLDAERERIEREGDTERARASKRRLVAVEKEMADALERMNRRRAAMDRMSDEDQATYRRIHRDAQAATLQPWRDLYRDAVGRPAPPDMRLEEVVQAIRNTMPNGFGRQAVEGRRSWGTAGPGPGASVPSRLLWILEMARRFRRERVLAELPAWGDVLEPEPGDRARTAASTPQSP